MLVTISTVAAASMLVTAPMPEILPGGAMGWDANM